jgi:pyridoxamine 5'-phosphate oxidase family protein
MDNTIFSQEDSDYLKSQRLARIVTAGSSEENGAIQPDVVPVGFDFDGEYLYASGMNLVKSTKTRMFRKIIRLQLSLMT